MVSPTLVEELQPTCPEIGMHARSPRKQLLLCPKTALSEGAPVWDTSTRSLVAGDLASEALEPETEMSLNSAGPRRGLATGSAASKCYDS